VHVELGARLGEWKIAGAKAHGGRAEKRAREFRQDALKMRHRDSPALVHHEAFDLREQSARRAPTGRRAGSIAQDKTTASGGRRFSITRIWPFDVCVRSSIPPST